MGEYKVLIGDPFGGYNVVKRNLSKEEAKELEKELIVEVDYFTSVLVKHKNDSDFWEK
jgi:hypothetical protein